MLDGQTSGADLYSDVADTFDLHAPRPDTRHVIRSQPTKYSSKIVKGGMSSKHLLSESSEVWLQKISVPNACRTSIAAGSQ